MKHSFDSDEMEDASASTSTVPAPSATTSSGGSSTGYMQKTRDILSGINEGTNLQSSELKNSPLKFIQTFGRVPFFKSNQRFFDIHIKPTPWSHGGVTIVELQDLKSQW